jgi:signal transduction histidine kinase
VSQLLALARAEHQASDPGAFESLDLAALARDVVREWVPQAMARGIDLGFDAGAESPPPSSAASGSTTSMARHGAAAALPLGSSADAAPKGPAAGAPAPGGADAIAPRPTAPLRILGVPMMLRELLNNLLDNALRYTPAATEPPGSVTVRVRCTADAVMLEVEDSGPGIAEAERHLVFDRFYRVLGTEVDGSGLGLAIVREIVAQHDALVRIGANPNLAAGAAGPGTRISIEFNHIVGRPPTVQID